MQRLYRGYIFEVIVVAVGAIGAVPVPLEVIVVAVGAIGAVPVPLEGNLKKTIPRK